MQIAVAGGGPAGSTVARILAGWGYEVGVFSAGMPAKAGEVIGPQAAAVLGTLRLDELFAGSPDIASRCEGVVSHWPQVGTDRAAYSPGNAAAWIVDRPRLDASLRQMAIDSGCRWLDARVLSCRRLEGGGFEMTVRRGNEVAAVRADLVIDATGRPARIARQLGALRRVDDWLVAAATCLPRDGRQADPFLYLKAISQGWWYRSDGPGGVTRIACIADPALAGGKPSLLTRLLLQIAQAQKLTPTEGAFNTSVAHMDASSARLECCARDGWLAVGDAGTSFDPLTGQGLAQAFGSSLAAAHAAREHLAGNRDALAAYDHSIQATYHLSRRLLDVRYAYYARDESFAFWRARRAARFR